MTVENRIKDEKLQRDINREAEKIPALSSDKICKYESYNRRNTTFNSKSNIRAN